MFILRKVAVLLAMLMMFMAITTPLPAHAFSAAPGSVHTQTISTVAALVILPRQPPHLHREV